MVRNVLQTVKLIGQVVSLLFLVQAFTMLERLELAHKQADMTLRDYELGDGVQDMEARSSGVYGCHGSDVISGPALLQHACVRLDCSGRVSYARWCGHPAQPGPCPRAACSRRRLRALPPRRPLVVWVGPARCSTEGLGEAQRALVSLLDALRARPGSRRAQSYLVFDLRTAGVNRRAAALSPGPDRPDPAAARHPQTRAQTGDAGPGPLARSSRLVTCSARWTHRSLHHVFIQTLETYARTYRMLYKLNIQILYVIH